MVQIWLMEEYPDGDPRLPHHRFPPKKITPDELTKRSGTIYWKMDTSDHLALTKRIALLKIDKNFKREDTWTLDGQNTIDFDEKLLELFEETVCEEDRALMVIEGACYYDVEDKEAVWLRILCEYGDLIIIPSGTNTRFTTTPKNFVKIRRFFKDE